MDKDNVEVFGKNTISDLPKSVRIREQRKSNNVLWWYYPHEPHSPIQTDKNKVISPNTLK
jgi:hypothetical protein